MDGRGSDLSMPHKQGGIERWFLGRRMTLVFGMEHSLMPRWFCGGLVSMSMTIEIIKEEDERD